MSKQLNLFELDKKPSNVSADTKLMYPTIEDMMFRNKSAQRSSKRKKSIKQNISYLFKNQK